MAKKDEQETPAAPKPFVVTVNDWAKAGDALADCVKERLAPNRFAVAGEHRERLEKHLKSGAVVEEGE